MQKDPAVPPKYARSNRLATWYSEGWKDELEGTPLPNLDEIGRRFGALCSEAYRAGRDDGKARKAPAR